MYIYIYVAGVNEVCYAALDLHTTVVICRQDVIKWQILKSSFVQNLLHVALYSVIFVIDREFIFLKGVTWV